MGYHSYREMWLASRVAAKTAERLAKDGKKVSVTACAGKNASVTVSVGNEEEEDERWTREELTCFKNGVAALAAAVVRQWRIDGSPKGCEPVIRAWESVYSIAREMDDND